MNNAPAPRGFIAYRGPSMLNGAPIVVVVLTKSDNSKTGDLAQSYILADTGDRPTEAIRNGADESICGDCKHRFVNARTCYVVVRQGATMVWRSLQLGQYEDATRSLDCAAAWLTGRMMRIGTYGDPAGVPVAVWSVLTNRLSGWVGYTHQWRQDRAQPLRELCMASVDSPDEMVQARAMGWRTFRVRLPDEPLQARESICPASIEGGHKLQCTTCRACNGARGLRGNIAIIVHGNHPEHRAARLRAAQSLDSTEQLEAA